MALRNIIQLMQASENERDLKWLQDSLVNAVQLELATLPPYLCGYWSIKSTSDTTAANLIRSIYMQEMKHMGLAANMLVGIGGTPVIAKAALVYPGPLPGGVSPELTIHLQGLTKEYVKNVYMEIEMPEAPLAKALAFPTIGAFYDAIADAFRTLQPRITTTNQQTSRIGVTIITTINDALNAIDLIKVEGEGTSTSPDESPNDPAHYYKFGSIYYGKTIVKKDGEWVWEGTDVPWPDVYPMAPVPKGGWTGQSGLPQSVVGLLKEFNAAYTDLLAALQGSWTGSGSVVDDAVPMMLQLESPAQALMQIPIGGSATGNYGPDFIVP
jgi:hypothetical protein